MQPEDYFPNINLATLRRLAARWAEEHHPVIERIVLARGTPGHGHLYALIFEVDPDADAQSCRGLTEWQGEDRLTRQLQSAYIPPLNHRPDEWIFFNQPAGSAALPEEFVIVESAIVLYGDNESSPEIEQPPAAPKPQNGAVIEINEASEGVFRVVFKGREVFVKHKGLRIAQFVVARPWVAVPYDEVNTAYGRNYAPPTATSKEAGAMVELLKSGSAHVGESPMERTDVRAISEAYREKLKLENDRDEAIQRGNTPLANECEQKIEGLQTYLNDAAFCGRPKLESIYRTTRARLAKAHQRALKRLGQKYPEAKRHLGAITLKPDGIWYEPGVKRQELS